MGNENSAAASVSQEFRFADGTLRAASAQRLDFIKPRVAVEASIQLSRARPKVLVLLAASNGAAWIDEQLTSILEQEHVAVQIVVSDDVSTDNTRDIVEKYAPSKVTLIKRKECTRSAAQNFFAMIRENDARRFDFVAFSDQDDIWRKDKLMRAAKALKSSNAAGYSSSTTAFWSKDKRTELPQVSRLTESDFLFEGAGQGCTFVLTRAFYQQIRKYLIQNRESTESIHYHDWAMYALARSWEQKWVFDPVSTLDYRQHSVNDTGARASIRGIFRRLGKIKDGWYRKQLAEVADLASIANPVDPVILEWRELLSEKRSLSRRFRVAAFCCRGGRRRLADRAVLVGAAFLGWV